MKLSVNETKWSSLLTRNRVLILYISIWIFDFGPEKLPGLSRNGPLAVTLIGCRKRRKLKALYPRGWIREWSAVRGEKDPFCCLFLLFYGLMVGKYALICAMEIQKIHMVVHIFSGFALFTESECIAELNPSASCWPLTRYLVIYQQTGANQNTIHLKTGFIWKFSQEWLLWTGYASGGSLRKKPPPPTVKY